MWGHHSPVAWPELFFQRGGGGTHLTRDGDEGEGRLSRPHTNVEISRGALARCATPWLRHYIIPVQRCLHEHAKLLFP